MSTQPQFLFAAKYLIAAVALSHCSLAHAQFTTIFNVPPDAAPSSIGSDTQLNFDAGGDDLPASFQAGLSGDADNVEVNINGGTVGDMFNAGPTDGSGGDVSVNVTGGTLGSVTSYLGAEVNVSGGELGYVTAFGGDINSMTGSTAVFQGFGASNGGVATFNGGTVTGIPGFEGGFVSTTSATGSPRLVINGGELMGVNASITDGSSTATLELNGGRVIGDVDGTNAIRVNFFMSGGEVTSDLRFDNALMTNVRISGGSLQTLYGGSLQIQSTNLGQIEILGGSIGNVDMTNGFAFVTYYGTQFAIDGSDATGTLTPGVATDVGSGLDTLSGMLADGTAFDYDFPTQSGFTSLVLVHGDYNGDGFVNAADYTVWRDNLGAIVPVGSGADGDHDGVIDADDYQVWRRTYGMAVPTPAASISVPEPATLCMIAIAWIAMYRSLGKRN